MTQPILKARGEKLDSNLQNLEQQLAKVVNNIAKKEAKLAEINMKAELKKKGGGKHMWLRIYETMAVTQILVFESATTSKYEELTIISAIKEIAASKAMQINDQVASKDLAPHGEGQDQEESGMAIEQGNSCENGDQHDTEEYGACKGQEKANRRGAAAENNESMQKDQLQVPEKRNAPLAENFTGKTLSPKEMSHIQLQTTTEDISGHQAQLQAGGRTMLEDQLAKIMAKLEELKSNME
ncbi:hypothetical protein SERLADRAFT_404847 [Serpula lacrymans var. lacrymans S7.9]|uniref:Uncharacterized protein n=1 Tax=Serpula lacrymans var. lacrymans (strain S7.9) TaxID=578457 RepID=F8NFM1_SERL9|nr:uncharacterized protein SERLADRAFT_404847 [Serpula lacrymans var. lacrymans S7.9]EGO30861.1 hypothetical protein SERLADRAFT_404847 [Serpula lacrymans var. lacrymans S7.9]